MLDMDTSGGSPPHMRGTQRVWRGRIFYGAAHPRTCGLTILGVSSRIASVTVLSYRRITDDASKPERSRYGIDISYKNWY